MYANYPARRPWACPHCMLIIPLGRGGPRALTAVAQRWTAGWRPARLWLGSAPARAGPALCSGARAEVGAADDGSGGLGRRGVDRLPLVHALTAARRQPPAEQVRDGTGRARPGRDRSRTGSGGAAGGLWGALGL